MTGMARLCWQLSAERLVKTETPHREGHAASGGL